MEKLNFVDYVGFCSLVVCSGIVDRKGTYFFEILVLDSLIGKKK